MSEFITATKNGITRKFSKESWKRSQGDWVEVINTPKDLEEATVKTKGRKKQETESKSDENNESPENEKKDEN